MKVRLVAVPRFLELPEELGMPREDQLVGTDAEKIIETGGRVCYDSFGKGRSSVEYHQHILDVGHGSVMEHSQFVFFITGVSRGLTHELVRHRIGLAISQRSTRYVDETSSPWIKHPLFEQYLDESGDDSLGTEWDNAVQICQKVYAKMVDRLENFVSTKGVDKLTARKQARGAARGVLGNALETELLWSANVRTLRHVLEMRASDAADAEIRIMAVALYDVVKKEIPAYLKDFILKPASDGIGDTLSARYHKV